MHDVIGLGAAELARRIADGAVSAREVVQAHIDRVDEVDSELNTVVVPRYEQALEEADKADQLRAEGKLAGPLHGVPITVKECFDVVGMPSSLGIPSRNSFARAPMPSAASDTFLFISAS